MKNSLIALSFSLLTMTVLHAKNPVPQFADYPVKTYAGKTAQLDLSDEGARMFRTRLRDALIEQPNFAGEYVTTMWGCGASCRMYSFVSKRTGKLLNAGFGGEENAEEVIDSRANSRLLVTQQENFNADYHVESVTVRFYVLENGKLKLLKTVKTAPQKED